ncbi:MAG: histidinol dehydrogenase [Bacteroidales bacterium]
METIINPPRKDWEKISKRAVIDHRRLFKICSEVFDKVKTQSDKALLDFTFTFDKVRLERTEVDREEMEAATSRVSDDLKKAINLAKENIYRFHKSQEFFPKKIVTTEGVECWQESRPIEKIGIYIPGGTAPLFSTVLMLAVPAKIAGCKEILLCSPPGINGKIADEILYTALISGVDKVYSIGGIQAIAAMTIGTESISKVNKIFGPGNQYVTAAKQFAAQMGMAIDMPAGPSEVLVMADKTADPEFIAADLLSQAEHGADSQVILITTEKSLADKVGKAVEKQLYELPRKDMASKSIQHSKIICLRDKMDCIDFINVYAPEHLILSIEDEESYLQFIINAGSVFIGNYTPESAGDYASGTNHTLPTNGFAKAYSGVNLDSFIKKITFQKISEQGLQNIGPAIELMAEAEGLQAHKNAVSIRLKRIEERR